MEALKVLLFGGTSEGHELALWMSEKEIHFTVSVATDYGSELLPSGMDVHVGRLDRTGMEALIRQGGYTLVIDATHPYASEVTRTVGEACAAVGVELLRLVRDGDVDGDWLHAADVREAAALLRELPGPVLLTTGSKELDAFAEPGLRERCWPRVLPSMASLERCLDLGFPARQVICMQGPFSRELNAAMLRQWGIATLVTKATGTAGGFWEKAQAARETGCRLLVIGRPCHEEGLTIEEVKEMLERRMRS